MLSQLELLKESLARLEPQYGPNNPYVQSLKAQIARYEKPRAENPVEIYSVGMRSAPVPSSDPQPETEADGLRAGALRLAKYKHQNAQLRKKP